MTDLTAVAGPIFSLVPTTLDEAMKLAEIMATSDLVPKDYRGKPGNVLVAVQMGMELGLKPMAAIQNIAVINGRPSIYGDVLLGLVKTHPQFDGIVETLDKATMTATCEIRRRGHAMVVRTFSKADAEKARLWGKEGPWTHYPERMLLMRARGFACRDQFPDALRGISLREEAQDIPEREVSGEVLREPAIMQPKAVEHVDKEIDEAVGRIEQAVARVKSTRHVDKETGEVTKPEPQPDPPQLITPPALRTLTKQLADRELTEEFNKHFGIADPSELLMSRINEALTWVREHAPA